MTSYRARARLTQILPDPAFNPNPSDSLKLYTRGVAAQLGHTQAFQYQASHLYRRDCNPLTQFSYLHGQYSKAHIFNEPAFGLLAPRSSMFWMTPASRLRLLTHIQIDRPLVRKQNVNPDPN